jgi:hypothetical protein
MKQIRSFAFSLCLISTLPAAAQVATTETAASDAPTTIDATGPAAVSPESAGRVRWGVNAQLGTLIPGPMVAFGVDGRVGWTFNRMFALYGTFGYAAGAWIGGSFSGSGGSVTASGLGNWYLGVNGEMNLGDLFFVAAGPGIGSGGWATVGVGADSSGSATQRATAASGILPSLDLKLGFGFGKRNPETGRRGGFTLGIDARLLFAPNSVFAEQSASGGGASQTVETRGMAVGLVPMLMLGYDSR